jgi:uncharacterized protein
VTDLDETIAGSAEQHRRETVDGMRIDWDLPLAMDDGIVLRADLFRPDDGAEHPVILTYGPYAKGLPFEVGYPAQWGRLVGDHPEVLEGSSARYQSWELPDPERWVPFGYACLRVDSRGAGRSPGQLDPFSPRETDDLYACIEWAGTQSWSNGRVGLAGISYYAINQWQVAGRKPPHLAAICPWEGAADWYRDMTRHGGIMSTFFANWFDQQVLVVQHGLGDRAPVNPNTGESVAGPETLSDEELAAARGPFAEEILAHPIEGDYHRQRSADWPNIEIPILSAANWGGHGLHARGNFEGFVRSASTQKWLEVHGLEHWSTFYMDYGVELQRSFFDCFLKGEENSWKDRPPVLLQVRDVDGFRERTETEWPLARTQWTRFYLDAHAIGLSDSPVLTPATVAYDATGRGVTFTTARFERETEVTGPLAAKLFVSSSTADADLFLVLRLFDRSGSEVVFQGMLDPHTPLALGWLRLSQRKLDPALSTEYRPYHAHDEDQPLTPGEVYEVDVEIWPTSIVVPVGYRLGLTIRGSDYEYDGPLDKSRSTLGNTFKHEMRGVGPYRHDDPRDRKPGIFGGFQTVHTGGAHSAYLLVPIIPSD